jgi:hypothetical protein
VELSGTSYENGDDHSDGGRTKLARGQAIREEQIYAKYKHGYSSPPPALSLSQMGKSADFQPKWKKSQAGRKRQLKVDKKPDRQS